MSLALRYSHTNDSAQLCVEDAIEFIMRGKDEVARRRAIDSLRHSIGILHPDYKRAIAE